MANEIEIINLALTQVGARGISALGDGSPEADVIDRVWNTVRQGFLADAPWRGATVTKEVTERPDVPPENEKRWTHWYDLDTLTPLPLGIHTVDGLQRERNLDVFWEIQTHDTDPTRVLLSERGSPITMQYSRDLDTVGLQNLERVAVHAMAWHLSATIAINFGKTTAEVATLLTVAENQFAKAVGTNSRQQRRRPFRQQAPLVDVRLRGGTRNITGPP